MKLQINLYLSFPNIRWLKAIFNDLQFYIHFWIWQLLYFRMSGLLLLFQISNVHRLCQVLKLKKVCGLQHCIVLNNDRWAAAANYLSFSKRDFSEGWSGARVKKCVNQDSFVGDLVTKRRVPKKKNVSFMVF